LPGHPQSGYTDRGKEHTFFIFITFSLLKPGVGTRRSGAGVGFFIGGMGLNQGGVFVKDNRSIEDIPCTREQIFNYLVQYKEEHDGNTPSNRQIAAACHVSPSTVAHHLARLERAHRLRLTDDEYRNIEIVGGQWVRPPLLSPPVEPETGGREGEETRLEAERLSDRAPRPRRTGADHHST
jgi:DNA-binding transcriptional ArsR family regulator